MPAPTVNHVFLIGYLGKDPELRTLDDGTKLVSFPLATNESYKDRNGKWQTWTDWHRIIVRSKPKNPQDVTQADMVLMYYNKGDGAAVDGKLKNRRYEEDGKTKNIVEVYAITVTKVEKPEKPDRPGDDNPYGAP